MQADNVRKTHPMVLVAAVAITIFSLLGSAVITGLIPGAHSERQGTATRQSTIGNNAATAAIQVAPNVRGDSGSPYITDYKSKIQPHGIKSNPSSNKGAACGSCGKIISISTAGQAGIGFMIKIRMGDGSYRTITQFTEPHYRVGDQVKLISRQLTMA